MDFQTPLAKVRGLGSAKAGTNHFWMQRITAIALIPLSLWMVSFTKHLLHTPYHDLVVWLANPLHSILAIAWIIMALYHAALGLQVVIEDYTSTEWQKLTAIWLIKLTCLFLGIAVIVAIFRVSMIA